MFKSFKLRQMAVLANQLVKENQDAFNKYNTKVSFIVKTNHHCVEVFDDVEFIIPYGSSASFTIDSDNIDKLTSFKKVDFCMNSMYRIAKGLKMDPLIVVENVITDLANYLRAGVHVSHKLRIVDPYQSKKEKGVAV
jgi:hypothetical protein